MALEVVHGKGVPKFFPQIKYDKKSVNKKENLYILLGRGAFGGRLW